jgi:hypothetical protein
MTPLQIGGLPFGIQYWNDWLGSRGSTWLSGFDLHEWTVKVSYLVF